MFIMKRVICPRIPLHLSFPHFKVKKVTTHCVYVMDFPVLFSYHNIYILVYLSQNISNARMHARTFMSIFSLHPRVEVGASGSLTGGAWLGEEAEEPSLTGDMGPDSTKPHSLLLHVENDRRARGGGEGGKKKKEKKWREEEEGATISGIC